MKITIVNITCKDREWAIFELGNPRFYDDCTSVYDTPIKIFKSEEFFKHWNTPFT